jgi:hypothetical protein
MLDSHSLAEYSAQVLTSSDKELEKRLGLYRVFLKLYEHHRGLLNEILDLENFNHRSRIRVVIQYVQATIQSHQVYLTTNLVRENTQFLFQSQNIWLIGRDSKSALPIQDKRLSRRHAAIQYVEAEGFYLVDLNSTNGSFVNGEPVRDRVRLNDGDQIRLGSIAFNFFICSAIQTAEDLPPEVLKRINTTRQQAKPHPEMATVKSKSSAISAIDWDAPLPTSADETSMFLVSRSDLSEL